MVQVPQTAGDTQGDDDIIDIRGLLLTIWRGKWVIMISALILSALAFVYVSQLARLIERVIERLRLDNNPEFNPRLRPVQETLWTRVQDVVGIPPEVLDALYSFGIFSAPRPSPDAEELERRVRLSVIQNVRAGLSLRPVGRSRVIEVSFDSSRPRTAAAVVNAIGEQYIVFTLETKLEATRAATTWLALRVDELRLRVQAAEEAVEGARAKLSAETGQSLAITRQQMESLNGALAKARNDSARIESAYERLTNAVETGRDLGAISEFRASSLIQSYRQQETELKSREIALKASVGPEHPRLVRLQAQLTEVQNNIADEASRIISAAEIDLQAAKAQEVSLQEEVSRLEQKELQQSSAEVELRQLDREADASRVLALCAERPEEADYDGRRDLGCGDWCCDHLLAGSPEQHVPLADAA